MRAETGSTLNPYTLLKKHFETAQPFSDLTDPNLNFKLMTWPIQQIRPAVPEFSRDIAKNMARSMREFFTSPTTFSMWRELYRMMPARSLVSQDLILHPELFKEISDLFNDDSGVMALESYSTPMISSKVMNMCS